MKVLVSGGRDYSNKGKVYDVLDRLHSQRPIEVIVHGGTAGADALAHQWAEERGVLTSVYSPNWKKHGRAAERIRNRQMLEEEYPHGVVAFAGGPSTHNLINEAKKRELPIQYYD